MEVELFTSDICEACDKIEDFFEDRGVNYEKHDVLEEEGAIERLKNRGELNGSGTLNIPIWCVEDSCFRGFSKEKIEKELNI